NSYNTLAGNGVGPTTHGTCNLISGTQNCSGPIDSYVSPGQYNWGDLSGIHDTSKSLVIAPIVDLASVSGFCPTNNLAVGSPVPVVGFALVFIGGVDTSSGNIAARVINIWACGPNSGTDPSNTGLPIPLRLIHT